MKEKSGKQKKTSFFFVLFLIFYEVLGAATIAWKQEDEREPQKYPLQEKIFGITIDDSWYEEVALADIIEAIKQMPRKPTLRIVMSKEKEPKEYVEMFQKLHQVSYIMATPVDSSDMIHYRSVESYRKRFEESYITLKDYVDLWEIGNEINGEGWMGEDAELIRKKMISAFAFLDKLGGTTALTAYYTKPGMQKIEMHDWLVENLSPSMKKNLDYLFISYYEDDNAGYQPDWKNIFRRLEKAFPNLKVGIGECGSTNPKATLEEKIKKAQQYYSMPKYIKNYVGGYFWWYWVSDCIPYGKNRLYKSINEAFLESLKTKEFMTHKLTDKYS